MTTQEIQARLLAYQAAELAILEGNQEYRIGARSFKRADLKAIQDEIRRLKIELLSSQNGGLMPSSGVVFATRR